MAKKAVIKKCVSQSLDPSVLPEQDQNIEEVTKAAKGSDDEEEEGNEDEVAAAEEDEEEVRHNLHILEEHLLFLSS